jgi:hypothetical protein
MSRRATTRWAVALLITAVLAAACGSSESTDTSFIAPVGGSGTDRYRWEVCRITTDPQDPSNVLTREVSLGYADHDRGLFTADHVRLVGTPQESRIQLATQGDAIVSREVFGTTPETAFLRDFPFVARDTPLSVAQLRTRRGVVEAFDLVAIAPSRLTDSHNMAFERFESMPMEPTPFGGGDPPAAAVLGRPVTDVVWVLDVWSDDRGTVQRIRLMTQDIRRSVAELRFSPSVSRWEMDVVPVEELGCAPDLATPVPGWLGYVPYDQRLRVPLRVSLDPDGDPYDVTIPQGVELRRRGLAGLVVPGGLLVTMDGNAAEVDLAFFGGEAMKVELFTARVLEVEIIEEVSDLGSAVLALRLQEPGTDVVRWGSFETAYTTDGGRGAITTGTVIERAIEEGDGADGINRLSAELMIRADEEVVLADLDGIAGDDTIVFSNGSGDGRFPLAKGYDSRGVIVAVVVFDSRYPWRLMVPDGIPPRDVQIRESQLVQCVDGLREVLGNGECLSDDA